MEQMTSTIDLHMHSIYSDGKDDLPELLAKVREAGIRTFALSDHDTIDGAQKMIALVPDDMHFIPSVEFSCKYREGGPEDKWSCHLLGPGADPRKEGFAEVVREAKQIRLTKMEWRYQALEAIFHISLTQEQMDWVKGHSSPGKPHLGQVLAEMTYAENGWTLPDEHSSAQEWEKYYDCFQKEIRGKLNVLPDRCKEIGIPHYSAHMEPRRAIEGVLAGGGVPVWAHPFGERREKFTNRDRIRARLETMKGFGLMGIECYYNQYNEDEVDFLLSLAKEYDLLVSGGSDYHSYSVKPNRLGDLNTYGKPVTEEMLTVMTKLS